MIEILENKNWLKQKMIAPHTVSVAGVVYGSSVKDFPTHKVIGVTNASIVARYTFGKEYFAADGKLLSLAEVINSVCASSGCLHFAEEVSFGISSGRVTSFSLDTAQLDFFSDIKTVEQLILEFGKPDKITKKETYGDLMGYILEYTKSKKMISWDSWNEKLNHIIVGLVQ